MCAFVVSRNLSFLLMDYFTPFFKQTIFDSVILKNSYLNRQKVSLIITNVIAPTQKERLGDILKNHKFSVLIDESTDITVQQSICIVVRYWDEEREEVHDSLWDLVAVFDGDENCKADSESIFNKVIKTFKEVDVPIDNITAFCSDTCNLMMGAYNSVSEKLRKVIKGIKIVKCACHIQHLCARDAIKLLPTIFESVPNLFYNYVSCSSKRCHKWRVIQIKSKVTAYKILRPVATRWLSYFLCMERIYKRWSVAQRFFEAECLENNASTDSTLTENMLSTYFQNALNKVYHAFLASIYSELYKVNVSLQSQKPLITEDDDIVRALYTLLLKMYMDEEYIDNVSLNDLNPNDSTKWKHINEISLSPYVQEELKYINSCEKMSFLHNCKKFLIELCNKMKLRYNFNDDLLLHVKSIHPKNALDPAFHERYRNLDELFLHLPVLTDSGNPSTMISINEEWKLLLSYNFPEEIISEENVSSFWNKIKKCADVNGIFLFLNVSQFALNVLCLPNSNAPSERIWSYYNREMTRFRASLAFKTIRGILLSSQYIKDVGGLMFFEPNHQMFVRMIRNLNDCIQNTKIIFDFSNYKGIPITEEYWKRCKEEGRVNLRSKKKIDLKDTIRILDDVTESNDCNIKVQELTESLEVEFHKNNNLQKKDNPENNINHQDNHLIEDFRYYLTKVIHINEKGKDIEMIYTVSKYSRNREELAIYQKVHLFSSQFYTLTPGIWVDGEVIDACGTIFEKNWNNAILILTRDSFTLFHDNWITVPADNWLLFKLKFPTSGKVLIPYISREGNHWRLFMLDIDAKVMTIIDPLPVNCKTLEPEGIQLKSHIERYVTLCRLKKIQNVLTEGEWKFVWFQSNRPYQYDGVNCGIYVIYYMNVIGTNGKFSENFNPNDYRLEFAQVLVKNSEDMSSVCQLCFSNRNTNKICCQMCKRFSHYDCLGQFVFYDLCKVCQRYRNP